MLAAPPRARLNVQARQSDAGRVRAKLSKKLPRQDPDRSASSPSSPVKKPNAPNAHARKTASHPDAHPSGAASRAVTGHQRWRRARFGAD
jgi:hypothetical protein